MTNVATERSVWPVLTRYDAAHLARIALPLGGIGTGTVSLGGRGNLTDWEIMNRPAKGFQGGQSLFLLYARAEGQEPVLRGLEGVIAPPYEGDFGLKVPYHGAPRCRECSFSAAYPLGQVHLADEALPVDVRLEAFTPFIPANTDDSSLPVAVLRYVLRNKTDRPVVATICGTMANHIGNDGHETASAENVNTYRSQTGLAGLFMSSEGVAPQHPAWGTMALSTTAREVSYKRNWQEDRWQSGLLHLWDDLLADGRLDDGEGAAVAVPMGALAASTIVPAGGEASLTFLLSWHFPNRQTWTPGKEGACCCEGACAANRVGNYYCTQFADAWDVACKVAPRLAELEELTLRFVRAFLSSDLPPVAQEAALYNLSTLRSQTCFRTEDGRFFGWEGCGDGVGCCYGSCTHVWNYEQGTAFTFGELACAMRDNEFGLATDERGHMSFRINLPIAHAREFGVAAADGQMGCIMKMYRDWQLSGDDALLRRLWPQVRAALAFAWVPGGWDADQDGVMEGCQHNTLDVEYYGPNPLMGGWYLGALRAGEEMARYLGDETFATRCRDLFARGSAWMDAHLFNGEYYEQIVQPPVAGALIAEGLAADMGAKDLSDPAYQVGPGCLVDQLVGQFMAHVCGLGYLLDPEHVRQTLESIMRYNFQADLWAHFNHMRTFALNDEQALLMCTYPRGGRPETPVPYCNEVMTGFEYSANVHMLYEGLTDSGLRSIAAIRARYDGQRRSPFDEAECGHHYARAMASWAAVLALSGFHYSAVSGIMTLAGRPGTHFWSTGWAWGTATVRAEGAGRRVDLRVLYGAVALNQVCLTGIGEAAVPSGGCLREGDQRTIVITGA